MNALTRCFSAALDTHATVLAAEVAREVVDRHRQRGRYAPALPYALVPVDAVSIRFGRALSARHDEVRYLFPVNIADVRDRLDQTKTFKAPWPDPGRSRIPFAVCPADTCGYRTLAIDIDAKMCDPDRTSDGVQSILQRGGVEFVVAVSGPEGSRHVLATWQERIPHAAMWRVLGALKERFPAIDIAPMRNPTEGCIRPPFARHYSSGRSRPIGDVRSALRILERGNPPEAWHRLARLLGVPLLSRRMEELLFRGDTDRRYASRSEIIQAIATTHVAAGSTEHHLIADLLDRNNIGGEGARVRRHPDQYVGRSWRKAVERVALHPTTRGRVRNAGAVAAVNAAVAAVPWPGQAGQTDWAVLLAHLSIAERIGSIVHDASIRDIALAAGVAQRTVTASHRRLREAGWLERCGPRTEVGKATRWRLRVPGVHGLPHTSPPCESVCSKPCTAPPGADVWRRRLGLGKGAARTYGLLGEIPRTPDDLAVPLGVAVRSVEGYLQRLAKYALATDVGGAWSRGPADPQQVGRSLGAAGAAQRDQATYALHRRAFRHAIIRRRHPDGPALKPYETVDPQTGEVATDLVAFAEAKLGHGAR